MTQTKESKTVSSLKEPTEAPFLSKHTTNNNDREWTVKTTQVANDTINPIRLIVEGVRFVMIE